MRNNLLFLIALSALCLVSCGKKNGSNRFDYGTVENGTYTNSFFHLKMDLPPNWYVLSEQQNADLISRSSDFLSAENRALQQTIETSKVTTVILLTAFRDQLEERADAAFNPNIVLLAENLQGTDNVKSAADYLRVTRNALQQDAAPKTYPLASFLLKKMGTVDFSMMRVVNKSTDNLDYTQDYYVALRNDFALTFLLTYRAESEQQALENVLNTVIITDK